MCIYTYNFRNNTLSLQYAVLGLLNKHNLSGYDIMKIFDHGLSHYWATEHTQIYRMLSKLNKEKLIDHEIKYQAGKPDKKIYKITESGRTAFNKWLEEPSSLPEIRHSQLLQFSFMAELDTGKIIKFLKDYEALILMKLKIYTDPKHIKKANSIASGKKEKEMWKLVLENGILYYKNEINWIHKAIKYLEKHESEDS